MLKCKIKMAPSIFHKIFSLKPPSKYLLRSIDTVLEPICKTKQEQFNICFHSPHLWNKIIIPHLNLRQAENLTFFLKRMSKIYCPLLIIFFNFSNYILFIQNRFFVDFAS